MIHCTNLSIQFSGEVILDEVSWHIPTGARIGLIGPNGAGKSTLLRAIAGTLEPDRGSITTAKDTSIGYLPQSLPAHPVDRSVREEALTAFEEVQQIERRIEKLTRQMEAAEDTESRRYQKMLERLEKLQQQLVVHEAHRIEPRTEAVLNGLGFSPEEMDQPLDSFSGGWRMRVELAKLLLRQHEVLLLDEPTNHLDIESIDWFESYLDSYNGAVVLVSHDRYFLDRMVNSIAELIRGQISEYEGNYSYYLEERERRREQQQAAYENQQRKIKEIQAFIDKFRYNASKAAQVQSRIKKLEKMDRIQPPPPKPSTVHFEFPDPPRSGRVVLELSRFSKSYAAEDGTENLVFDGAGPLHVDRGDKIALMGSNGAGKSTLARIILGEEAFEGERTEGHNVSISYFAQHQAEALNPDHTVLEELRSAAPRQDRSHLRAVLGAFLFTDDDVFKSVRVLSGGEKNRLALAKTLVNPANFLVLDEPTNHLDMRSREVLSEALQQFAGTFLIISHDRHFLNETANRIWHVRRGGRITTYPGSYSQYRWSQEHGSQQRESVQREAPAASPDTTSSSSSQTGGPKSKEQKRREARARNRRYRQEENGERDWSTANEYQLQQEIDRVEDEIFSREEQKEELEEKLANPELYKNEEDASETVHTYNHLEEELEDLYERWEMLAEYVD